jgi:hypothetical protein
MPTVKYPGLIDFVKEEIIKGTHIKDIYDDAVRIFGYEEDLALFYSYVYKVKMRHLKDYDEPDRIRTADDQDKGDKLLSILQKRKIVGGEEACDFLSTKPKELFDLIQDLRKDGFEIICDEANIILSSDVASEGESIKKPIEDREIIFGVASDLHFGSKECQITALNEFAHICRKKGVKYMLCPGDVFAGYRVYKGQEFEVYAMSAQEQEESAIVNLPEGFEWYMLGGNHDYSFIKSSGHNPLLALENQRPDVHYVGYDDVNIPILPGVDLKMWHPSGGVPYSVSYRLQKGVEQIAYSELANISRNIKDRPSVRFLLCGHLHVQMQAMFGSIFGAQCGTFEGQTTYLKRKGLHPLIGGYIIKADIAQSGIIRNFDAKYYMFPKEIQDDWKNYNHSIKHEKITKPLFS